MRIAFIVDCFPAVSETFIARQIQGVLKAGHEVRIFAGSPAQWSRDIDGQLSACIRLYNAKPQQRWRRILKAMALLPELMRRAPQALFCSLNIFKYGAEALSLNLYFQAFAFGEARRYDAVVAHFGPNGLVGARMKEMHALDGRLYSFFHAYDLTSYVKRTNRKVYDPVFQHSFKVLAISERGRQKLIDLGCPLKALDVFHMGVDPEVYSFRARGIDSRKPLKIISVARLVEKKGIAFGIEAVRQLVNSGLDVYYTVIGDGDLRGELESLARCSGLEERVLFQGSRSPDHVRLVMDASDIFLLPSITSVTGDEEGIPVVLMEALALGIPVVACDNGAVSEIIEDGRTGVLVPSASSAGIQKGIRRILDDPAGLKEMSFAGRLLVEKQYNSHRLDQEFETLLKGKEILL